MACALRGSFSFPRILSSRAVKCVSRSAIRVSAARMQSTSTMDLVYDDECESKCSAIHSTWQVHVERDYSSNSPRCSISEEHWNALAGVASTLVENKVIMEAHEMDLIAASQNFHLYDKIIFLIHPAEDESQVPAVTENEQEKVDTDTLTQRGIGQALNLSRRTAAFCNKETYLIPELFVAAPSRKVLQTLFMSFPYDTPHHSLTNTPWICHPYADSARSMSDNNDSNLQDIEHEFHGVDCSLCRQEEPGSKNFSDTNLLYYATDLLQWLMGRREKVVVVSGDEAWLEAIGCTLDYAGASTQFNNAELRAVGVRFT